MTNENSIVTFLAESGYKTDILFIQDDKCLGDNCPLKTIVNRWKDTDIIRGLNGIDINANEINAKIEPIGVGGRISCPVIQILTSGERIPCNGHLLYC